jgi:hypothetical protein
MNHRRTSQPPGRHGLSRFLSVRSSITECSDACMRRMRQADLMLQVGGVQETVTVTAAVLAGNGVGGAAAIVANRVLPLSANQATAASPQPGRSA